jgi:hypothetical protein
MCIFEVHNRIDISNQHIENLMNMDRRIEHRIVIEKNMFMNP